jgi:hypothetical protein
MKRLGFVMALLAAGCGVKLVDPCAGISGACVAVQVQSAIVDRVDTLSVRIIGGGLAAQKSVGGGALPIALGVILEQLPSSPVKLQIDVQGTRAGQASAGTAETEIAPGQHQTVVVELAALAVVGAGGSDLSSDGAPAADGMATSLPDLAEFDLGPCVPVTPRLLAPLSTAMVTQKKPTLRWQYGSGACTVKVDLCQDRACNQPLAVGVQLAADQASGAPTAPLPTGWVFWRVNVTGAGASLTSATWQLWVGPTGASSGVDSSSGATLDVNGDGYADVLVGAPRASVNGVSYVGRAHLYLGGNNPPQRIDLDGPDGASSDFGGWVASAGDVNGDGYADFLVGSSSAVHLYWGGAAPTANDWNGATPAKRVDVAIVNTRFGAGAGDVNGDGYADFLLGAQLFLGSAMPMLIDWTGTAHHKRLDLPTAGRPAGAGDVNGDGLGDFLIGGGGSAALYLGEAVPNLASDWGGTTHAKRIDLVDPGGTTTVQFGGSVAGAGDVNGDGYADFLVGVDGGSSGTGAVHLYFGEVAPLAGDYNGATASRRIDLTTPFSDSGQADFGGAVAGAGDVNGDGYADFVVGAWNAGTAGAAHLYLGGQAPNATAWQGGTQRIDLSPPPQNSWFGMAVAGAGDFDGDGIVDFLAGGPFGGAHLYLGGAAPDGSAWNQGSRRIDLVDPDAGSDSWAGASFASAGGHALDRHSMEAGRRMRKSCCLHPAPVFRRKNSSHSLKVAAFRVAV